MKKEIIFIFLKILTLALTVLFWIKSWYFFAIMFSAFVIIDIFKIIEDCKSYKIKEKYGLNK